MSEPLKVEKSRAAMVRHAQQWMIEIYGRPLDMSDQEQKDRWHQNFGLLCCFIAEVFPE